MYNFISRLYKFNVTEDITKELLMDNYDIYNKKLIEFNKKYNNFLTDIDSIYELLLLL